MFPFKVGIVLQFMAEDAEHAIEQFLDTVGDESGAWVNYVEEILQ